MARNVRICEACFAVDDHPRHVQSTLPGESGVLDGNGLRTVVANGADDAAINEAMDSSTTVRHMDCCAELGCAICADQIEAAGGIDNLRTELMGS